MGFELVRAGASEPAVRASYMKQLFATLGARGVLEAIDRHDPELVRQVEAASRVSWLPVSLNVRAVEAAAASLGDEQALALFAECVYGQFETPLWHNFISGALRLLGRTPGSLGRWIPQAIQIIFRDCGKWSVENRAPNELTLTVRELPPELAAHRLWLRSLAVGMTPVFLLCNTKGSSELVEVDAEARGATYLLAWDSAPS